MKAKINIGDLSRGGVSRGISAIKAADHDMNVVAKLTPVGVLNLPADYLLFFASSIETSDLIIDCLELW